MSNKKKMREENVEEGHVESGVYTYVGQGEDPPRKIKFMGVQEFVRGKPTEVTDPDVLYKIEDNPCFVKGEVAMEDLHAQDEEAAQKADERRKADAKINAAFHKKYKTE